MSILSLIAPCIVFGTCCYFLAKKNVVEAILMTIGSGIGILIHLFYILLPLWISSRNIPYTEISKYYTLTGIIGALASLCFAAGFLILVYNTVKKNSVIHDQFPKSND
jgi:Na+-transporting NADH:ubiquinone oxidoreductase subunit NqrD